jgi:hypothetical protein
MRERDFKPVCFGMFNELLQDHPGLPAWPKSCVECEFLEKCEVWTNFQKNPELNSKYVEAPIEAGGLPFTIMDDVFKTFTFCPYCGSKNIEEETLEYYFEMERFPMEYQRATCKDCDGTWSDW